MRGINYSIIKGETMEINRNQNAPAFKGILGNVDYVGIVKCGLQKEFEEFVPMLKNIGCDKDVFSFETIFNEAKPGDSWVIANCKKTFTPEPQKVKNKLFSWINKLITKESTITAEARSSSIRKDFSASNGFVELANNALEKCSKTKEGIKIKAEQLKAGVAKKLQPPVAFHSNGGKGMRK